MGRLEFYFVLGNLLLIMCFMGKEVKEIRVPGIVGVLLVLAVLFVGVFIFARTMEWLTSVFSTPQLIFAFALLIPAAFLLRYLSTGALVFNIKELEAMEGAIEIFSFLFFGVGFFVLTQFFMPDSLKEASNSDTALGYIVGVVGGVAMMACFIWFFRKLKIKSKLKGNLEGYRLPRKNS